MKLESDGVWTITKNHLQILDAAEALSSTHEYIPIDTLKGRARARASFHDLALDLVRLKFLTYKDKMYKLSISGLDCLAINTLRRRGLRAMGSNIGIGKESDIYHGEYRGRPVAIKIHRLGRTSFRKVEERGLKDDSSWFALNKESCRRECDFLALLAGPDVPELIDHSRHVIVMELLDYDTLYRVKVDNPDVISTKMMAFVRKMWDIGYVHGDFNEFNVMVRGDDIKVLDFPQCIPVTDPKATAYLKRDIECVHKYFWKKNFYVCDDSIMKDVLKKNGIAIDVKKNEIE